MHWYFLGVAILVVLIIIAYRLGQQQPNNNNNNNNNNSQQQSKQPVRQVQQQPVRQQPRQQAQTNHPVPVRQQQPVQRQQQPVQRQQSTSHRKIEYAAGAALHFIEALHAEGVDRGAIYSLGTTFRIDQQFTTNKHELQNALIRLGQSKPNENTALYDSIALAIEQFQRHGRQNVPWVLIVLTDGKDNASQVFSPRDKRSPAAIGHLASECFAKAPSNYFVLVGVGDANSLDVEAITTIGQFANSPAIPLANFHMLEELFLRLVVQVSETIVGRAVRVNGEDMIELAKLRQVKKIGIDYALVIDRSGSMDERC